MKKMVVLIAGIALLFLIFGNKESVKKGYEAGKKTATQTEIPTKTDNSNKQNTGGVLDKINALLEDSDAEVTIWSGDNLAKEGNPPYEVVINFPLNNVINCDSAKRQSYYLFEELYKEPTVQTSLNRVLITIPHSVRVSLGASDGVPMAQKGSFTGPTNFWKVMENFNYEDENGELKNRTWGVLLDRCK